jgi:hypothetical protein
MYTLCRLVFSADDIGPDAWRVLNQDAADFGRRPKDQALALIRFALKLRLDGKDTELSRAQLDRLLGRAALEPVA